MARQFSGSTQSLSGQGGFIISTAGRVTYAAWVRVDAIGDNDFKIHQSVGANSAVNAEFALRYVSGQLFVRAWWNALTGSDSIIQGSVPILPDGTWRFVAAALPYSTSGSGGGVFYGDAATACWQDWNATRTAAGTTSVASITTPYTQRITNPGGNKVAVAQVHYARGVSSLAEVEEIRRATLPGEFFPPRGSATLAWPLGEGAGNSRAVDVGTYSCDLTTASNLAAGDIAVMDWVDPLQDVVAWRAPAQAPTVEGSAAASASVAVAADGTVLREGYAGLSGSAAVAAVPNADLHATMGFAASAVLAAGVEPEFDVLDMSNMSLDYVRPGTVNTWWPRNGELNGGQMSGDGSYSMLVDTTTQESGSAAIGWQLANYEWLNHYPERNRFRHYFTAPAGSTGNASDGVSDTRTKTSHGRVHGKVRFSVGALGNSWDHWWTKTPVVVFEDASRVAVCTVWVVARGEGHALYLAPGAATSTQVLAHPEWLVTHLSYDASWAGQWFDVEYVIDTDPGDTVDAGRDVRAGVRVVAPWGSPSRWLHLSWAAADWTGSSSGVCSWLYGQAQSRDSSVDYAFNAFKLDAWWAVTGDRWWFHHDFYGAGYDGWDHHTEIAYLAVGTTTHLNESSAWTVNTLNTVPCDHSGTPTSCATLDRRLVVDLADWSGSAPGRIVGVAAKVVAEHNSGTAANANGLEIGLCDTSNTFVKARTVDIRGASQCRQAYTVASELNLAGDTWTVSDVNALRVGFRSATNQTSNSWRLFAAGVYVAYVPAQTSTVATVGEPVAAPTASLPGINSGQGSNDSRGDPTNHANALRTHNWWEWWPALTTDLNNANTAFPVFVDYNPANGRYYAAFWGASPFGTHSPAPGSSDICAGIVEWDPFSGEKHLIWRADESAPSSEPGGPHMSDSGSYVWRLPSSLTASQVHGSGNRFHMHSLRVDKRPTLDDGTTPNPFYGHLFATFFALNNNNVEIKNNHMVLWLNPMRTAVQNADGTPRSTVRASEDYCWARRVDMPNLGFTDGQTYGSPGSYWCCPTERYIFATRLFTSYSGVVQTGSQILWLDKKPFSTGSTDGYHADRWSGGTAGVGYPQWRSGESNFSNYWALVGAGGGALQAYVNQQYYCAGWLWTAALQLRRLDPKAVDIGASLKSVEFKRGTDNPVGGDIAQANLRYVATEPSTGRVWVAANMKGCSRVANDDWDINFVVEVDPDNDSGNPEILRWFRVPTERARDVAGTDGAMTGSQEIHGLQCVDPDTILVNMLEEVDTNSPSGTYFPYTTVWLLRPSRNEWVELQKPAKNAALTPMLPFMNEDSGVWERPSPPPSGEHPSRAKSWRAWKNDATPLPDEFRQFLGADLGWTPTNSSGTPFTYRNSGGDEVDHQTNGFIVRWWAPTTVQAADEIAATIQVDVSGITPTPPTQIDEWVCEIGGTGLLGSGAAVDGGGPVVVDPDGTATLNARIPASDYQAGTGNIVVEFFWRVGTSWSARRVS